MNDTENNLKPWQNRLHEIIYEADTPAGKVFDLLLIVFILASVGAVLLDSVGPIRQSYGALLAGLEWFFTIIFTVEYILRLVCVRRPLLYATSFFGVIDLLAILPSYLELALSGANVKYLLVVRVLRVLRIFRVLKLAKYLQEANYLLDALHASRRKVFVFFYSVIVLVTIIGSLMYLIEQGSNEQFSSIPRSIYWAIVTITTVGYGDMAPQTDFGRAVASFVMLLGYAIIAVPTGIVTVELNEAFRKRQEISTQACPSCTAEGHAPDARYCKKCGEKL
jgi:voltage-gated potassium channel